MTGKKDNENREEINEFTDNLTENTTNDQVEGGNQGSEDCLADNMAGEFLKLKDNYLRLMAEYDNYRKRTLKEKTELIKNGGEKVLIGLLPVLDDFERALQNIDKATDLEAISEGISLIYNKFTAFLNQNGVKAIDATGKPFDEELFDAVAIVPTPDKNLKGKVMDCMQTGYTMNDKVIRHAKVVVAE